MKRVRDPQLVAAAAAGAGKDGGGPEDV